MTARLALALALMLSAAAFAAAQSRIPASEMPGRERERFNESPVERFMRPGAAVAPPLVEAAPRVRKQRAKRPRRHKDR